MSTLAKSKTTIELNGKLYDVRSGKVISSDKVLQRTEGKPATAPTSGMVVDGFVRRSKQLIADQPSQTKPTRAESHPNSKGTQNTSAPVVQSLPEARPKPPRTAAAHAQRKAEKSKTLMRPAVKKPQAVISKQKTAASLIKKENPARHSRAAAVPKSSLISRFNSQNLQHVIVKKQTPLAVVNPNESVNQQLSSRVASLATSTEAHVRQSVDIIEESLRNATSHLEQFEEKLVHGSRWERLGFRNKAANIATLSFAGILLFSFFAFQNAANFEMRLASARTGVSAQMPGYHPTGFSPQRGIKTGPGTVSLTFSSNTDDREFTLTQQSSNWSSEALLANHVLADKTPYQSYQQQGKTVYIFDDSNATWVNGGVWYQIDGNASLTTDQLLRIANSF